MNKKGDSVFHPLVADWFDVTFGAPTSAQQKAWPAIAARRNALLLAPTGSGKTLAAFLVAIDRIMFPRDQPGPGHEGVRVLYISPLKALGVDVERNLRAPVGGIEALAAQRGVRYHPPRVAVRSGDTPAAERARLARDPPDILITTPESLYLLLTSKARQILRCVETVIVDEIHVMVASKRGAHLFVSLERLERLRGNNALPPAPLQRVGLSATQRPLDEVARLLGGFESLPDGSSQARPVDIIEADGAKSIDLAIEVPVDDMTRPANAVAQSGAASAVPSIWPSIYPRLVELIRGHRSTMIFVNSRRLAERLAAAVNELSGEELALAHHGSIARQTRLAIENRLKLGDLPAIVATSSLELGLDMGAVDLVIQIGSPPTLASGLQRIGRAGHQVGATSKGIIFPRYRGDLLAAGAAAGRMLDGLVEHSTYPRNALDVLAQQLTAIVAMEPFDADELYRLVCRAAPYADLPRASFDGVLDSLSGRYPSSDFAGLAARLNWDRLAGRVTPRRGTQRVAVLNGGTIPDRGLYGVFFNTADGKASRVGELDEEMVFETRPGDVFLLGASSWRVVDIDNDRVLVVPAPGQPGRMPFWRGDGPGRPLEFGRAIGALTRQLLAQPEIRALEVLRKRHRLDERAAENLLGYLFAQRDHAGAVPDDRTIVIEAFLDEIGDWRVVLMSPFGARVHAPWAMAVAARLRGAGHADIDMVWTDDGIVFRLAEASGPPATELFLPDSAQVRKQVIDALGASAMFAARFRENAARALLLPRRQPGKRTPLWLQRRRSADLLEVASRYPDFPVLLETYRECLQDVFDLKGLRAILEAVERRDIVVQPVDSAFASPFAASLLFSYVGSFIYNGDAPLAERRAAALSLDRNLLRELLGDAELRDLVDPEAVSLLALKLQRLDGSFHARDADDLHSLMAELGDLSVDEIKSRCAEVSHTDVERWIAELIGARRIVEIRIGATCRCIGAEDAGRYRDALGSALPGGLPQAFLDRSARPLDELVARYARTHIPFTTSELADRFALGRRATDDVLAALADSGRLLDGEFLPGGRGREWCDPRVLQLVKRASLARLRKQVEPVEPTTLARFLPRWHGIDKPRAGTEALLSAVEQLEGCPLSAWDLFRDILPARIVAFRPNELDDLCTAGEVVWQGIDGSAPGKGKIALYLADHYPLLAPPGVMPDDDMAQSIVGLLDRRGALFFDDLVAQSGAFRNDVLASLWTLVWAGIVTNDTLSPLRSGAVSVKSSRQKRSAARSRLRARRALREPGSEGRWSLLAGRYDTNPDATARLLALTTAIVERHGIVTRESLAIEALHGGFSAVYPVLKEMETSGRLRRGYFVDGLGAAQFALPGAAERLRERIDTSRPIVLAANDPANAWGAALRWPAVADGIGKPGRVSAARVVLLDGQLLAYLGPTGRNLLSFLPEEQPQRTRAGKALGDALKALSLRGAPVFLERIDGRPCAESALADTLGNVGFALGSKGLLLRPGIEAAASRDLAD